MAKAKITQSEIKTKQKVWFFHIFFSFQRRNGKKCIRNAF